MKKLLLIACMLCLLALVPLGTGTASEETHCYIIGDVCIIISNVCFLDSIDCGDGLDWESQQAWKRGWCMAAIYAGAIHGTVWQCADGSANTIAEKVLIADVNGLLVLWQFQQFQVQQASMGGNQQAQQSSSNGGGNQQSSSSGGGQQQPQGSTGGNQQSNTGGSQQSVVQTGGDPQQPQQPIVLPPINQPDDGLPEIPPNQQDQQQLLLQILNQQQEPQYQQAQGPRGEQEADPADSYPDCVVNPNSIKGSYYESPCINRNPGPTCSGSNTYSQKQRPGNTPCTAIGTGRKCEWVREEKYGGNRETKTVCNHGDPYASPCATPRPAASDQRTTVDMVISTAPTSVTWTYRCSAK